MKTLKPFTLIITILILTACSAPPTPTATPQPTADAQLLTTLTQNRQKWDALKVTHYRFKLNIGCFCGFRTKMPLNIEVGDEKVVSILDNNGQSIAQSDKDVFNNYNTIEKIFHTLTDAINSGADHITAEYNPESGYPRSVFIDYGTYVSDDEISFTITDFQIIK